MYVSVLNHMSATVAFSVFKGMVLSAITVPVEKNHHPQVRMTLASFAAFAVRPRCALRECRACADLFTHALLQRNQVYANAPQKGQSLGPYVGLLSFLVSYPAS